MDKKLEKLLDKLESAKEKFDDLFEQVKDYLSDMDSDMDEDMEEDIDEDEEDEQLIKNGRHEILPMKKEEFKKQVIQKLKNSLIKYQLYKQRPDSKIILLKPKI